MWQAFSHRFRALSGYLAHRISLITLVISLPSFEKQKTISTTSPTSSQTGTRSWKRVLGPSMRSFFDLMQTTWRYLWKTVYVRLATALLCDLCQYLRCGLVPGYAGTATNRPQRNYTTIMNVLYAPLSRGRTHITSSDSRTPPEVDPAYYTHPLDAATHAAGINLARKTLTTPPMDSIYLGEFEPGSNVTSPQDISSVLRAAIVASDNHVTGTMAMMPKDLGGVVDTKLLVYGIDNVRVAGALNMGMETSADG